MKEVWNQVLCLIRGRTADLFNGKRGPAGKLAPYLRQAWRPRPRDERLLNPGNETATGKQNHVLMVILVHHLETGGIGIMNTSPGNWCDFGIMNTSPGIGIMNTSPGNGWDWYHHEYITWKRVWLVIGIMNTSPGNGWDWHHEYITWKRGDVNILLGVLIFISLSVYYALVEFMFLWL